MSPRKIREYRASESLEQAAVSRNDPLAGKTWRPVAESYRQAIDILDVRRGSIVIAVAMSPDPDKTVLAVLPTS